jgi:hypothetical protein
MKSLGAGLLDAVLDTAQAVAEDAESGKLLLDESSFKVMCELARVEPHYLWISPKFSVERAMKIIYDRALEQGRGYGKSNLQQEIKNLLGISN